MEIGSIFEIDLIDLFENKNQEFFLPFMENKKYDYHYFFNTGRSAIEYLLKQISSKDENKKILLPSFNCASVIDAVKRANIDYDFYTITEDFQIDIDSINEKLDENVQFIYIIQYFGGYQSQESYDFLKKLQLEQTIIIEDLSHALYTKHEKFIGFGDYVLGSIRKWLPIPDGAFLSSKKEIPKAHIENGYNEYTFNYLVAQLMKKEYLSNRNLDKHQFLSLNQKAIKSLFTDYTIRNITELSLNYIHSYDMNYVMERRLKNYYYLNEKTKKISFLKPVISLKEGQIPFGYVVFCEKRDMLLKHLINNNVYCNVHWRLQEEVQKSDRVCNMISKKILTIPCDQRYGKTEMDYIINVLKNFENDN